MSRITILALVLLSAFPPCAAHGQNPKETVVASDGGRAQILNGAREIDRIIQETLKANGLKANPKATDQVFLRRAYLDIAGTIPTGQQAMNFTKAHRVDKRQVLVDYLLNSESYVSHYFNYWADVLRVKSQIDDLELHSYIEWLKESLRQNKPYDQWVRELLAARGRPADNGAVGYYLRDQGMPLDNLSNTLAIFLGTQVGCAQCHDHPFEAWTQRDFYQLAAFTYAVDTQIGGAEIQSKLNAVEIETQRRGLDDRTAEQISLYLRHNVWDLQDNPQNALRYPKEYKYENAKPGDVVIPQVIFGQNVTVTPGESPRDAFARWATSPENPQFARVIANRLWKKVMGVGLIEPLDDLEGNVASNPELLDFLTKEMIRLKFDVKQFLRMLFYTDLYSRQSVFRDASEDFFYFPGPVMRRMSAEQVWDSLVTLSTGGSERASYGELNPYRYPLFDVRSNSASQIVENGVKMLEQRAARERSQKSGPVLQRASELRQPTFLGHLLRDFGQSDRELPDGGNTDPSVSQILTMLNGRHHSDITRDGTLLTEHLRQVDGSPANRIRVIYLSILGREPLSSEEKLALQLMQSSVTTKKGNADLIWVLLNIPEFLFIQ